MAILLDGRALSKTIQSELQESVRTFVATHGYAPCLAVVQVQGDEASDRYVRAIRKRCHEVGMTMVHELLPSEVSQEALNERIRDVSHQEHVHGVIVQMPLPSRLSAEEAVFHLDYRKDVDGAHPMNAGLLAQGRPAFVPCTPAGGMLLLERYAIPVAGKRAAVVGRSAVVGRPMAALLLQAHATVTICHSRTPDLGQILREQDIVVVATGRAGLVTGDMIRPGATVVDFGINPLPDGTIVGDVDFARAVEVAGAITPVPGGTGPVTNMVLLQHVLRAAQWQVERR